MFDVVFSCINLPNTSVLWSSTHYIEREYFADLSKTMLASVKAGARRWCRKAVESNSRSSSMALRILIPNKTSPYFLWPLNVLPMPFL